MRRADETRSVIVAILAMTALAPPLSAQQPVDSGAAMRMDGDDDEDESFTMREALVVGDAGTGGRRATHTDAIEALLVRGEWESPVEGATVERPDGEALTWRRMAADENGWIQDASIAGGYALWTVESSWQRIMLLDASGDSLVYVNGEPRAGDPYRNNWPLLPVEVERGRNEFLFSTGRGGVKAKLLPIESDFQINPRDLTLPDLVAGERNETWVGVIVINATRSTTDDLRVQLVIPGAATTHTPVPPIPPLSALKVACRLETDPIAAPGDVEMEIGIVERREDMLVPHDFETVKLKVIEPGTLQKITFISEIDGSVQYYAVQPMRRRDNEQTQASAPGGDDSSIQSANGARPALVLSLHGAGVETIGQAGSYASKGWAHVVAPTNRRPFGFDWEDWGRLDALEVLRLASERFDADQNRTYLTGHSMGGHGTWIFGATHPDRFAAIAPSAGWRSFRSYGGAQLSGDEAGDEDSIASLLRRATNPSDTLGLSRNFLHYGVYILHGDRDDNVPVSEARAMREHLGGYHADFAYYERPGAGHWWGAACVDWPPLFDFLQNHARTPTAEVRHIEFITANPAISSESNWVAIEAQRRSLAFSSVNIDYTPPEVATATANTAPTPARFSGRTENVARLRIDLDELNVAGPMEIELDGQSLEIAEESNSATSSVWLARGADDLWSALTGAPSPRVKGPHRSGPFKQAFQNRMIFVYGTDGDEAENAWALAKARFDAETFWYRGNGSVPVVSDEEFLRDYADEDRNVILYGATDTNSAWEPLLNNAPISVRAGAVEIEAMQTIRGDDLAVIFCYPRFEGGDSTLVGVVSGTGIVGMRLTNALPWFVSGVHYPDLTILSPEMLETGDRGVVAAGFFGNDWTVGNGEILIRDEYSR